MNAKRQDCHLAFFVSPHGFGHATRAIAVMQAFFKAVPNGRITAFTTVSEFLFKDLPPDRFNYVALNCDVGLVQESPMVADLPATCVQLQAFWHEHDEKMERAANRLRLDGCNFVVCDIAPLGILAAKRANLPVALIENFTWDWIYASMVSEEPGLRPFAQKFAQIFGSVDLHIQAQPFCAGRAGAEVIAPIVRSLRQSRHDVRQSNGFMAQDRLVLITMGGFAESWQSLELMKSVPQFTFLLPGFEGRDANVVGLGSAQSFYHPDWVAAADLVIGKLGYSTVVETVQAGSPMAYLPRPDFPESAGLEAYLRDQHSAVAIEDFNSGEWVGQLGAWSNLPRHTPRKLVGADQVVALLAKKGWVN